MNGAGAVSEDFLCLRIMPDLNNTSQREELLVAIMNDPRDMAIARKIDPDAGVYQPSLFD